MATYGYKAITKAGKEVKGSLEADNKDLAMAELRRQELTVIDLGEQSFLTKDIDIQIGGWPKARDLSVMCRQFVSMTKAGVSILESLKMLCEQTENKRLQEALKEVRISVEKLRVLLGIDNCGYVCMYTSNSDWRVCLFRRFQTPIVQDRDKDTAELWK